MKNDPQPKDAHLKSLKGIQQHAAIGRVPMLDYACEFAQNTYELMPDSSVSLIQFLHGTEMIKDNAETLTRIQEAYSKLGLQTPVGIEDLPAWWGSTIMHELEKPMASEVMKWDSVFLQGAFLDIQYPSPIYSDDYDWPEIGAALMRMHQMFIPGPFTTEAQLTEFF